MVATNADPRVRVRIFAYLLENGLSAKPANRIARKVVRSMVMHGAMPGSAVKLAGAAVTKAPRNEKQAAVLVEPKAEPYETVGGAVGKPSPGGGFGHPGVSGKGPIPTFLPRKGLRRPAGNPVIRPGAGAATNFTILEPIRKRREVHGWIGRAFSPVQVKELANEVDRAIRDF